MGVFAMCLGLSGDPAEALYDVEAGEIAGQPGSIIRVWPLESGGPGNSDAFRFLYRSTGLKGEAIPVSGAIFIPSGPPPAGGRNIIAWAHPTFGVAPECAPSLYPDRAGLIWNLSDMLSQGYIVVATDYPGLGTDGVHPYLIGESAGRAVLDSVRAARHLSKNTASNRFAVWGHSEGGHAALFTGELAARYAPELMLVGVAAAAPATYLVDLFEDDAATEQDLIAMALLSWTGLENISPATIVEPAVMPAFNQTARDCLTSVAQFEALEKSEKPLQNGTVSENRSDQNGALERDHGAQLAGSGAGRSTGLYRPRLCRYDGGSAGHEAFCQGAVRPRRPSEFCRTSRRVARFRRARRRSRRHQMDERPLQGCSGPIVLPIVFIETL